MTFMLCYQFKFQTCRTLEQSSIKQLKACFPMTELKRVLLKKSIRNARNNRTVQVSLNKNNKQANSVRKNLLKCFTQLFQSFSRGFSISKHGIIFCLTQILAEIGTKSYDGEG